MEILVIIPARGGSKGIPKKNIKKLNGKPLIEYTLDIAKKIVPVENICVSTDDNEVVKIVESNGIKVPFIRPKALSTDTVGTNEVILHSLSYYDTNNIDLILLLQPTSPFRNEKHIQEIINSFTEDIDMVVSVKEVSANPYYNCFEENELGFLNLSKGEGGYVRRQDVPKVWEFNGSVYLINRKSIVNNSINNFRKIKKYVMNDYYSIDIDTPLDWKLAEIIINQNKKV